VSKKYIYPLIDESPDKNQNKAPSTVLDSSSDQTKSARKTRYDKKTTLKFPVTDDENAQFRSLFKAYQQHIGPDLTMTSFLTMVFRYGLRHPNIINHGLVYKDTKIHKTLKPNQIEKELVSGKKGLTVMWKMRSDRKTTHRLMISMLHYLLNGGTLSNEGVQPFKPFK
jgi:hypothetical protein